MQRLRLTLLLLRVFTSILEGFWEVSNKLRLSLDSDSQLLLSCLSGLMSPLMSLISSAVVITSVSIVRARVSSYRPPRFLPRFSNMWDSCSSSLPSPESELGLTLPSDMTREGQGSDVIISTSCLASGFDSDCDMASASAVAEMYVILLQADPDLKQLNDVTLSLVPLFQQLSRQNYKIRARDNEGSLSGVVFIFLVPRAYFYHHYKKDQCQSHQLKASFSRFLQSYKPNSQAMKSNKGAISSGGQ